MYLSLSLYIYIYICIQYVRLASLIMMLHGLSGPRRETPPPEVMFDTFKLAVLYIYIYIYMNLSNT